MTKYITAEIEDLKHGELKKHCVDLKLSLQKLLSKIVDDYYYREVKKEIKEEVKNV